MSWDIQQTSDKTILVTMNSNKVNCMNDSFFADCHEALSIIEQDFPNHGVVLTGQGSIFSAGLDIKHVMPMFARKDETEISTWFKQFNDMILRIFQFGQPMVAAINGHAFAGGLILALCCEHRSATTNPTQMSLNEIAIGLAMPSTMTEIIRHSIGTRNTERAILSHRIYANKENIELGFVHECVAPEQLIERAQTIAEALTPEAMLTYRESKKAIRQHAMHRIRAYSENMDKLLPKIFSNDACLAAQQKALNNR